MRFVVVLVLVFAAAAMAELLLKPEQLKVSKASKGQLKRKTNHNSEDNPDVALKVSKQYKARNNLKGRLKRDAMEVSNNFKVETLATEKVPKSTKYQNAYAKEQPTRYTARGSQRYNSRKQHSRKFYERIHPQKDLRDRSKWQIWQNPSIDRSNSQPQPKQVTVDNSGCSFNIRGDLSEPQPVYIHVNTSDFLRPNGKSGMIKLNTGEQVIIACTGSGNYIVHPDLAANTTTTTTVTCVSRNLVSLPEWPIKVKFESLKCKEHCEYVAIEEGNSTCYSNKRIIRVGFVVAEDFYPLYESCFDPERMEVLYVCYDQSSENAVHQTGVSRPGFLAGSFYQDIDVDAMYTKFQQNITVTQYVGPDLAKRFVTGRQFLSRGHLAAKSDFVFATGQRSTFFLINAAPQWSLINSNNWAKLEENLRARIGDAGYNAVIYTGTFGVTQLRNQSDHLVDIYLVSESDQIPVPLYFYKVVYVESEELGTAFITINNPYYTAAEVRNLVFCKDRCRGTSDFDWVGWKPDRIELGYSFCCAVDDFNNTVGHLPALNINKLLI